MSNQRNPEELDLPKAFDNATNGYQQWMDNGKKNRWGGRA
jgi:hypothetical protein